MNQEYFEKLSKMAKKVQAPLQEFAELNVKTLQDINYLKPEELTKLKKPEEILEKQMDFAMENCHKALDYMQKSFQIYEKAMLCFLDEVKKSEQKEGKKH